MATKMDDHVRDAHREAEREFRRNRDNSMPSRTTGPSNTPDGDAGKSNRNGPHAPTYRGADGKPYGTPGRGGKPRSVTGGDK